MRSIDRLARVAVFAAIGVAAACAPTPPPSAAPETTPTPEPPAPPTSTAVQTAPTAPPPPLPTRPVEFPAFQQFTLPSGLHLIVVEKHDLPVVNVDLYVESGNSADPEAKAGLAAATAELLTKGTTTRTAKEISTAIEGVGGSLSASSGRDYTTISASVLADHLDLALDLVSDVAENATFPADELEIARTRELSSLQAQLAQPDVVASRVFRKEIYGEDSPYAIAPTAASVKAISREDIQAYYRDHFNAANSLLVVSGDVDADAIQAAVRQRFAGWTGTAAAGITFPTPPTVSATHIYLVDRPGSVQSNIQAGGVTITPDSPDYYPLQVMNKILGGGTDSRLFRILREEKGWTYSPYSGMSRPENLGYFVAGAEVRTAVTDSSVVGLIEQLRRIRDEPVSQIELDAAKNYLVGSFPLRIETAGQIASQVAQTILLGLPISDLTQYREKIQAVTIPDVQRVARKYIQTDSMVIVVVGDASQVHDELAAIAPVVLLDVEGHAVEAGE